MDITPGSRMVEVISSNDERDLIAFGANRAHSFTSKLPVEIRYRAQKGEKEVEIADLVDNLLSTAKQPTRAVKADIGSIVLLIPPGYYGRPLKTFMILSFALQGYHVLRFHPHKDPNRWSK